MPIAHLLLRAAVRFGTQALLIEWLCHNIDPGPDVGEKIK